MIHKLPPPAFDEAITRAWCKWAASRGGIRLTDGREGILINFATRGGLHKVLVGGRYLKVPTCDIAGIIE